MGNVAHGIRRGEGEGRGSELGDGANEAMGRTKRLRRLGQGEKETGGQGEVKL